VSKDPCASCGSVAYYHWSMKLDADGNRFECCSECSKAPTPGLSPDVYFDSKKGAWQTDINLADRYTGPIPFSSKREKADIMKRLGLRESGDKVHGARNWDKKASKQWDSIK
jgi:hypothetical protein